MRNVSEAFARRSISARTLLLAWIAAGVLLVITLSFPSIDRAQEARVLETAREMMDAPVRGWMIPVFNGEVRLQKPPLAYWLAASAFKLFGVRAWAGRLPFAMAGWLAVGLTQVFAARLFGRFAGFLSAGALLGGMMFAHHARLAEADVLVLLFVTAAVYAFFRAFEPTEQSCRAVTLWFYAGSLAIAFAILSKGLPALFALLFLVALAWKTRRCDRLLHWIKCGAPLAMLLLAAPWFIYAIIAVGPRTFAEEAKVAALGEGHRGWFVAYLPQMLVAIAPWTAFAVAAVAISLARVRRRRDLRLAILLLWLGAVVVPLCLAGQKQKHYLMSALPPLAILTGWFLDRSLRAGRGSRLARICKTLLIGTAIASAFAGLGIPVAARMFRGGRQLQALDLAVPCGAVTVAAIFLYLIARRRIAFAILLFLITSAIATTMIDGVWVQTLKLNTPENTAAAIRQELGNDRPIRFYGTPSLPLIFALRTTIPSISTPGELAETARREPGAIILIPTDTRNPPQPLPDLLIERRSFAGTDKTLRVCEFAR